jgi:hypothetical protein
LAIPLSRQRSAVPGSLAALGRTAEARPLTDKLNAIGYRKLM